MGVLRLLSSRNSWSAGEDREARPTQSQRLSVSGCMSVSVGVVRGVGTILGVHGTGHPTQPGGWSRENSHKS